jgi:ATP-binding cassette subfamily B protein
MTTDVNNLQNAYQQILRVTVRAPFRLILSIVMCLVINIRMSFIFIVALVILSFALTYIISHVSKLFTQVFQQYDQLNSSVQENVSAIRVVKAFVREDYEELKFSKAAQGLYNLYVKAENLMAFNHPIMNMVVYGCIIALSWFGAHFIVSGSLTTGELTSLFTYVMSILMSLMMLSMIFVMLTMSAASGQRVAEIIEEEPDIVNPKNADKEIKNGSIEFNHVSFAYHEKLIIPKNGKNKKKKSKKSIEREEQKREPIVQPDYALNNIDFHIKAGETIGVIGGTGSGKSSLVNLINRLYDVTKGSIFVGGKDVRTYDLETLRNAVSVVLQNNVLFSGTIIDNLRWGNPNATLEECRHACDLAQASEFIDTLPDGYDSWIEQGGANFSGGQKQRLCIARALLKNPKILILDDSTSACDTATDAKIRDAFKNQIPNTTKLIIAQRISSVRDCDRIMVMENGKLTGFDTHENLLKNNSIYQEIHKIQTEGGGDFDEPSNIMSSQKKKGGKR